MQMLYDSDHFVVVHLCLNQREIDDHEERSNKPKPRFGRIRVLPAPVPIHAFEIVDKTENKEVLLHGDWAAYFQRVITAWQQDVPSQEAVESILNDICTLAQLPMVVH